MKIISTQFFLKIGSHQNRSTEYDVIYEIYLKSSFFSTTFYLNRNTI